jgi:hypothetical protein
MGKIGAKAGWQSPSLQRLPEQPFRMVGRPDYSHCSRNARSRTPLARANGTSRRAISSDEGLPILSVSLFRGLVKAALYCAHRTSTFRACAFCEQEVDQAAHPILLRPRVARAQETNRLPSSPLSVVFSSARCYNIL